MKISKDQVEHIALLARLELSQAGLEKFTQEFSDILGYVEKLNEVNVDNVTPARGWLVDPRLIGGQANSQLVNKLRDDEVTREESEAVRDKFVSLAPEHDGELIKTISPLKDN